MQDWCLILNTIILLVFKSGRLETKFLSLYKTWSCCLLDSNLLSYKWDLIAFLFSRVQLFSLPTCLGRGLFIPFLSFYPKRADWKNYPKAGRYERVTNSQWVSQTYIFLPWVFPFSDGLGRKFWNCARNSCQNGSQEIFVQRLLIGQKSMMPSTFLPSYWLRKLWPNSEVIWCNGALSWLAEGMLRSDNVHMVPNDVMQIPFDWLGDLTLIPDWPST